MRSISYDSENESVLVLFNGELTTAVISDKLGNTATGHALHHPDDTYSATFGQALAVARASSRYFRKVEKKLVRGTK